MTEQFIRDYLGVPKSGLSAVEGVGLVETSLRLLASWPELELTAPKNLELGWSKAIELKWIISN